MITIAELRIGVLVAREPAVRSQRMRTLSALEQVESLPVDDAVGREFAELVAQARSEGRRPKILDCLIGATARSLGIPVYGQDADFETMPGVEFVRV